MSEEFLEFDETTARLLGWNEFCEWLAGMAQSEMGKRLCLELRPAADAESILARQRSIQRLLELAEEGKPPPLEPVADLEKELQRAEKGGALVPEAIRRVAQAMKLCARARGFLLSARERGLSELGERMSDLFALGRDLEQAFDESGQLRDSASPELGQLRRRARELAEGVRRRLEQLMRRPGLAACLSDNFITQRAFRYVIPVRADAPERVAGIVHDTSQSGATLFVEPAEIVEDGNRLRLAEAALQEHEQKILLEFSREIGGSASDLRQSLQALAELDLLWAVCQAAERWSGRAAQMGAQEFCLLAARHPLMAAYGRSSVPNDIRLEGGRRCLIVSGPNAGGKTVTLKTAGLSVMLAQAGVPLPAGEESRLPVFRQIHAVMGDEQDLARGLSTFTGQLVRIQKIIDAAGPDSLVLVDEVLADTDPVQGAALAAEVLRTLVEKGALAMVTTHFEPLKQMAYADERFANASVGFDLQAMSPTYQLHPDIPGRSLTFDIARNLGLSPAVLERAARLVDEQKRLSEEMLAALEAERLSLQQVRERLGAELEGARRQAEEAARVAGELDRERRTIRRRGKEMLLEEVREARRLVAELTDRLRNNPSPSEVARAGAELKSLERSLRSGEEEKPFPPRHQDKLEPGMLVRVEGFAQPGKVLSLDERSGVVCVRMGCLVNRVAREMIVAVEAATPAGKLSGAGGPARVEAELQVPLLRTPENTLDLRGRRADEAVALLEKFLDDMYLCGRQVAFVIHGHGTGALRAAVRRYLETSPYQAKFASASPEEGGEGTTIVKLE